MCLKLREKVEVSPTLINLKDDDYMVVIELFFMASTIKYEVLGVLESFLSFLRKYEAKFDAKPYT